MDLGTTLLLNIGAAAALALLLPSRRGGNVNAAPTGQKPRHVPPRPIPPPSLLVAEDGTPVSSTAPRRERKTMKDEITLTKQQLQAAMQTWEQQSRDGKWPARPDLTAAQVAAESTEHLWSLLAPVTA